jgi:hypothetical protein
VAGDPPHRQCGRSPHRRSELHDLAASLVGQRAGTGRCERPGAQLDPARGPCLERVEGADQGRVQVCGHSGERFDDPPAGKAAATLLSFYLPGAALAPDQRANGTVDVALGAKFTALATPTAVTKALISAKLTQESPSRTAAATPSTPRC